MWPAKFTCNPLALSLSLSRSPIRYLSLPLSKRCLRINQKVGAAIAVSGLRWVAAVAAVVVASSSTDGRTGRARQNVEISQLCASSSNNNN